MTESTSPASSKTKPRGEKWRALLRLFKDKDREGRVDCIISALGGESGYKHSDCKVSGCQFAMALVAPCLDAVVATVEKYAHIEMKREEQEKWVIQIIESGIGEKAEKLFPLSYICGSESGVGFNICSQGVRTIFRIGPKLWLKLVRLQIHNQAPNPHGNSGVGKSRVKKELEEEIGPQLKEMWMARPQISSKRKEFTRFLYQRGWSVPIGRNVGKKVPRTDSEWTEKGENRLRVCSWSKYSEYVTTLEEKGKESPTCLEVETPTLLEDEVEATTLLEECKLTEQSVVEECRDMDIVEKKRVVQFREEVWKQVYDKVPKHLDDVSNYPIYTEWKANLEQMKQELLRPEEHVQDDFETATANKTPPLPNKWPRGYTFDSETRVLRVDFTIILKTGDTECPKFFYQCLERTDIAVVSVGSVVVGDSKVYTLKHLCESNPTYVHHSYQKFSKTENHLVKETGEDKGLRFSEYKSKIDDGQLIYMTDLPIRDVRDLAEDFNSAIRPTRGMMPGGPHCLMQHVSKLSSSLSPSYH
jgi:hypothetical protein